MKTKKVCKVKNCGKEAQSLGFCSAHYQQDRRKRIKANESLGEKKPKTPPLPLKNDNLSAIIAQLQNENARLRSRLQTAEENAKGFGLLNEKVKVLKQNLSIANEQLVDMFAELNVLKSNKIPF